jgi:hypothetical protein
MDKIGHGIVFLNQDNLAINPYRQMAFTAKAGSTMAPFFEHLIHCYWGI